MYSFLLLKPGPLILIMLKAGIYHSNYLHYSTGCNVFTCKDVMFTLSKHCVDSWYFAHEISDYHYSLCGIRRACCWESFFFSSLILNLWFIFCSAYMRQKYFSVFFYLLFFFLFFLDYLFIFYLIFGECWFKSQWARGFSWNVFSTSTSTHKFFLNLFYIFGGA